MKNFWQPKCVKKEASSALSCLSPCLLGLTKPISPGIRTYGRFYLGPFYPDSRLHHYSSFLSFFFLMVFLLLFKFNYQCLYTKSLSFEAHNLLLISSPFVTFESNLF